VRLVDAAGVPLADVPLDITAAGGRTVVPTDGDGRVELGGVAPGKATVRLADPDALAAALSGREAQASGPVEPGDDEIAVTPTRLIEGVPAHSDQPLTVVLLTALEIVFTPGYRDGLALEDGSELHAFESGPVSALRMHAIGDGAHAVLPEPMPDPLEPPPPADPPPPGPTVWEPPNIYHVQAGDYLVKIAQVYLGDGARWPEIWALNKHRFPGRSPDELYVGDTLIMPPEAVPAFVGGQVQPQQGPSAPPLPPPPWMNVDVEDLADALASGNFGTVFDWLGSLPTEPPPVPEVDLGFGPEEAIFAAHVTEAALAGQVDPPPGNEQQV
jgi:nucleoid-associated protein YgaU